MTDATADAPAEDEGTPKKKGSKLPMLIGLVLAAARAQARSEDGAAPLLLLDEIAAHLDALRRAGLSIAGWSVSNKLVEMVEIPDHPWFVACQFHPEFTSTPRDGHPLFSGFIEAARAHREQHRSKS